MTWLYGPLQSGSASMHARTEASSARLSKSNSFVNKKPILKKRSMSELMLQRSLSTSSLVKQAAAAVQAQQSQGILRVGRRPGLERSTTDYLTFPFSSRHHTHPHSAMSSGIASPSSEKKHIHFNEQVAQCIAVDIKGEEEDDDEPETDRFAFEDSDSDDGAIMMKTSSKRKKLRPALKRSKSSQSSVESKTIAMLPSTTLKYREDTPELTETAMKHSTSYRGPGISPSSSQETLKPSKSSRKFSLADDDDEEDDDEEDGPSLSWRSSSKTAESLASGGLRRSGSSSSLSAEPAGMRRTASGMFMPYEEGEGPSSASEGLFGRVIDTVNTARDIAHVIWNVGWRK